MLDTSDYDQDSTPPQQRASVDSSRSSSENNEESMLAVDEGLLELISSQLQAARDEVGFKHAQGQRDTDLDALLEEYRSSLSMLFGSEPSLTPSAMVLAANTEDDDHTSTVGTASAFAPEPSSPACYVTASVGTVFASAPDSTSTVGTVSASAPDRTSTVGTTSAFAPEPVGTVSSSAPDRTSAVGTTAAFAPEPVGTASARLCPRPRPHPRRRAATCASTLVLARPHTPHKLYIEPGARFSGPQSSVDWEFVRTIPPELGGFGGSLSRFFI